MTHTRRPILLCRCAAGADADACAGLGATTGRAPVTQPPPQRPSDGSGDQGRIQMPRRAGSLGPARDRAAAPEVGTGRIRGRVVDDTGQALRRVIVRTFSTRARASEADSRAWRPPTPRVATSSASCRLARIR